MKWIILAYGIEMLPESRELNVFCLVFFFLFLSGRVRFLPASCFLSPTSSCSCDSLSLGRGSIFNDPTVVLWKWASVFVFVFLKKKEKTQSVTGPLAHFNAANIV